MLVVLETHFEFSTFERGVPVSIIGYVLPSWLISQHQHFLFWKFLFCLSAVAWMVVPFLSKLSPSQLRLFLHLSTWSTVVSYIVVASIFWENLPFFLHKYVVPAWLLLIHAIWYHFYRNEIIESVAAKTFWKTPLYPRWVFVLSVYVISMLYTLAGISKLRATPDWGSGLSMQLWTYAYGDPESPVTRFILADRFNAALIQKCTLVIECLAFLAIFNRYFRLAIGLGLIAMHCTVDITFHIDFIAYIILLIAYFMPLFEWSQKH